MRAALSRLMASRPSVEAPVAPSVLLATETGIQAGCLSSRLYHDENEEAVFMFEQVWRNQDYLDLHLRSEHYRRMLLVMEMAGEPPEIKFHTISEAAGIEVIEKARGCKRNGDV